MLHLSPMMKLLLLLLLTFPLAAQENALFPRFSLTGAAAAGEFETNVRIDAADAGAEGTEIGLERELGLEESKTMQRFGVQWRPLPRHELSAAWFSTSRAGLEQIDRDIRFRDETYPVRALVSTQLDLDYGSLSYTWWARRSERDGVGIVLGAAAISIDAGVTAARLGTTLTATQRADTDVPIALGGLQGRFAFTPSLLGEATVAALPRLTIDDYTGSAVTGTVRLEYRALRWLGIGAAYHYFDLDIDVAQGDLRGAMEMTVQGPEAFVRLAF